MKTFFLLAASAWLSCAAYASPESDSGAASAQAAIQELGRINGQALACQQSTAAGEARILMLRHAPKSRQYGELFEAATNGAFLEQGRDTAHCPGLATQASRLSELSARLQAVLPAAP